MAMADSGSDEDEDAGGGEGVHDDSSDTTEALRLALEAAAAGDDDDDARIERVSKEVVRRAHERRDETARRANRAFGFLETTTVERRGPVVKCSTVQQAIQAIAWGFRQGSAAAAGGNEEDDARAPMIMCEHPRAFMEAMNVTCGGVPVCLVAEPPQDLEAWRMARAQATTWLYMRSFIAPEAEAQQQAGRRRRAVAMFEDEEFVLHDFMEQDAARAGGDNNNNKGAAGLMAIVAQRTKRLADPMTRQTVMTCASWLRCCLPARFGGGDRAYFASFRVPWKRHIREHFGAAVGDDDGDDIGTHFRTFFVEDRPRAFAAHVVKIANDDGGGGGGDDDDEVVVEADAANMQVPQMEVAVPADTGAGGCGGLTAREVRLVLLTLQFNGFVDFSYALRTITRGLGLRLSLCELFTTDAGFDHTDPISVVDTVARFAVDALRASSAAAAAAWTAPLRQAVRCLVLSVLTMAACVRPREAITVGVGLCEVEATWAPASGWAGATEQGITDARALRELNRDDNDDGVIDLDDDDGEDASDDNNVASDDDDDDWQPNGRNKHTIEGGYVPMHKAACVDKPRRRRSRSTTNDDDDDDESDGDDDESDDDNNNRSSSSSSDGEESDHDSEADARSSQSSSSSLSSVSSPFVFAPAPRGTRRVTRATSTAAASSDLLRGVDADDVRTAVDLLDVHEPVMTDSDDAVSDTDIKAGKAKNRARLRKFATAFSRGAAAAKAQAEAEAEDDDDASEENDDLRRARDSLAAIHAEIARLKQAAAAADGTEKKKKRKEAGVVGGRGGGGSSSPEASTKKRKRNAAAADEADS